MILRIRWEGKPEVEKGLVDWLVKDLEEKGIKDVSETEIVIRYVTEEEAKTMEYPDIDMEANIVTEVKETEAGASFKSDPVMKHRRNCSWFEA
jgi:hypothetical protein